MPGPMDDFAAKTAHLTQQVDVLITRVKALAEVGELYQVEDAVEEARAAALRAEAAADSILALDISTAEDAAAAAAAATTATDKALEVGNKHGEVVAFATTLPTKEAQINGKADAAAGSATTAQLASEVATNAKVAALQAKAEIAADVEVVNNGVAAVEEVRASIGTLNEQMAAAIAAAEELADLSDQLGTAAFSSTFKFAGVAPGASVSLDADAASMFRLNLTQPSTAVSVNAVVGSATKARQITLFLRQGTGSNKVTWSSNIRWVNGMAPVLSFANGREDVVTLIKCGTDSTFYGFFSGDSFYA